MVGPSGSHNKVFESFKRATTTSFGSICFGSLLIAIIQALKALVERSGDDDNEGGLACFLRCVATCILQCLEDILEFFNTYAFVHVAFYGDDYCTAGKKTWGLICASGWDMIINDDLTGLALGLSAFAG